MYGVPANLDLSRFMGASLIQVAIGEFQVIFSFHPSGSISVEGAWELHDSEGSMVDESMPNNDRAVYRCHRLLGQEVVLTEVDPPRSFSLTFKNGMVLRVFDDSKQYESFSIQPGNIYV